MQKKKSDLIQYLLQADDEEHEGDKLKVLNDGDGVKLLMDVYTSYVSDDDFVKFPKFMRDVDTLLYKARGNRGLTKEDRLALEEEAAAVSSSKKRGKRKKGSAAPPPPPPNNSNSDNGSGNTEMAASDLDTRIGNFFERYLSKAS